MPANTNVMSTATILGIIFSGHCTPVECIEEGCLLAPSWLYTHVEIEIDLHAKKLFHFVTRLRADLLEHRAASPDDDAFLPIPFDTNGGEDAREPGGLLPPVDYNGD